jgi:hypothetical protein
VSPLRFDTGAKDDEFRFTSAGFDRVTLEFLRPSGPDTNHADPDIGNFRTSDGVRRYTFRATGNVVVTDAR